MNEVQEFLHSLASIDLMSKDDIEEELKQIECLMEEYYNTKDVEFLEIRQASLDLQLNKLMC